MTKRTDAHRPSAIRPQDYELAAPIAGLPWWKSGPYVDNGTVGPSCDHCGHALRYYVRFTYLPTGEVVRFGEDCADLIGNAENRVGYMFEKLRKAARERERQERKNQEWQERRDKMVAEHSDVVEWLNDNNWETEKFSFLHEMKNAFDFFGSLTSGQINAVRKIMAKRYEQAVARLNEELPTTPAPDGRLVVTGTVLSTKWKHDDRFGDSLKMFVRLDDNNKVYGTVPSSLEHEELRGKRIQFTATFTRTENDDHFSYFKRPAKAVIV